MGALLSGFRRPGAWGCFLTALGMFLAVALLVTGTPAPAAASDALPVIRLMRERTPGARPAAEDAESLTAPDGVTAMAIARLANAPVDPQAAGRRPVGRGDRSVQSQRSAVTAQVGVLAAGAPGPGSPGRTGSTRLGLVGRRCTPHRRRGRCRPPAPRW